MAKQIGMPAGELLDERLCLDLEELSRRCAVETSLVVEMVQVGLLEPSGGSPREWGFSGQDLVRLQRALRLRRDLGINLPGLALCIDLLEERDRLRVRIRVLEAP